MTTITETKNQYRVTVDTGGTFTDFVCFNEHTSQLKIIKVPSTPHDPSEAIINGLHILAEDGIEYGDINFFSHGTTVGTNALLEEKGVKTGLVVTKGFRGIYEVGDQARDYGPEIFNIYYEKPKLIALERNTEEVQERINFKGEVTLAPDETSIRSIARRFKRQKVESVAVSLLFSFINPKHEQLVKDIFRKEYPECNVSISSELLPQIREYPRLSTTVINAYLNPIVKRYISRLTEQMKRLGVNTPQSYVMQSNGGVATFESASEKSVSTILSGPAGGVVAGLLIGSLSGYNDIITFDMGGTSCDVSLLKDGSASVSTRSKVDGRDIAVPMLDINTVSAGGGTIARVDEFGALIVGPDSAGSDPGPVCYGRNGTNPTITDANAVLGYLHSNNPLGGRITIDTKRAAEVMEEKIAEPLGLSVYEAADGILQIVNVKMEEAIKAISSRKGFDLRDFSLIAFGGAGPLHAGRVALNLGIPRVIVPTIPGVTSAFGLLIADVKHDYIRSRLTRMDSVDPETVSDMFQELVREGTADLLKEGFSEEEIRLELSLDMRYAGQGYDLAVPVANERLTKEDLASARRSFDGIHEKIYGHSAPGESVEIVSYRLTAIGSVPSIELPAFPAATRPVEDAISDRRNIYFKEYGGLVECPIYNREKLGNGHRISGPAIIEQIDSTIVICPEQIAEIDSYHHIIISRKEV